jgi:peptidoglycan hydrolase-like protein with peptidoglycan-binding domain
LTHTRAVRSLLAAFLLLPLCGAVAPTAGAATARAAALGQRQLSSGSTGSDVKALQQLLTKSGLKVGADGEFGPATLKAVQTFQSVSGLAVTGVVDAATLAALRQATSSTAVAAANNGGFSRAAASRSSRSLGDRLPVRRGMSGRDVKMLQGFLRKAGVRPVTVDGEFGRGTYRAVRKWEARAARAVNGIVDAGDVATLRQQVGAVRAAIPAAATAPAPAPVAATPVAFTAGPKATVGPGGLAIAPAGAPDAVKRIIAAGNQIATKTYIYGGGHRADWKMDAGYDCSGSVSWALHGAGLLQSPLPSGNFMSWGDPGPGQWVTLYANSGHIYMIVAGLRFDTSGRSKAGTRWQTDMRDPSAFAVRHPRGL